VIFGSSDESAEKSQLLIDVFLNRQVDAFIMRRQKITEHRLRHSKKGASLLYWWIVISPIYRRMA